MVSAMDLRPTILCLLLAGCATAPINADRLDRAIPPTQWELLVDGLPVTTGGTAGVVAAHRSLVGEGRVRELAIVPAGAAAGPPRALLRYALPGGRALPVELGAVVTITLRPSSPTASALLLVEDDTGLRAAIAEGAAATAESLPGGVTVTPAPQMSYRESRRMAGYCEATVEHRAALVTIPGGEAPDRITLHTGERRLTGDLEGGWEVLLLDNAAGVAEGCADVPLSRFAYLLLAAP